MAFPALLDACVLIPIKLTDLLLRLAEADTYRLLWSRDVLDEVERNLERHYVFAGQRVAKSSRKSRADLPSWPCGFGSRHPLHLQKPRSHSVRCGPGLSA
jgi:hypothetical protein